MRRLLFGLIVIIIAILTLAYLWSVNPVYAFVGGVAMIVFMVIGYVIMLNIAPDVPEEIPEELRPRRTGEFKAVYEIEKPEEDWRTNPPNPPPAPVDTGVPNQQGTTTRRDADHSPDGVLASNGQESEKKAVETVIMPALEEDDDIPAAEEPAPAPAMPGSSIEPPSPAFSGAIPRMQDSEEESGEEDAGDQTGSSNFDLDALIGTLDDDQQQAFLEHIADIPSEEQTEDRILAEYQTFTAVDAPVDEAQFTAYYPRQASANTDYGFYVYAHLPDALIAADVQQFESLLGGRVPKPKMADATAQIDSGTMITVMVHCDALTFNQVGAIKPWRAPFIRFDFKFNADQALVDEIVNGRVAILIGMIEIASIDFQIGIVPYNPVASVTAIPQTPLNAIGFDASETASIYQKIFVSYSRKDAEVAEQYRLIQQMAGNTIFMDTHSIRAGDDWESALKQFIDEADTFQLFWSEHSAISDHVRFEWEYALTHRCPETRCIRFIRPAYWRKPMPEIPPELSHLHFAYVALDTG